MTNYDIWLPRMQRHIWRFQLKYANRVCSASDIRQECMLKLWLVADRINPDMTEKQQYAFVLRCLENHLIDKTMKFRSAEGHSRTWHRKLEEERPWQLADRGAHVGVRTVSGEPAVFTAEDIEFALNFFDELDFHCTREEIEFICDHHINGFGTKYLAKKYRSDGSLHQVKRRALEKLHRAVEDAR